MGSKGLINPSMVIIGRIGAPYGVRGCVHVQSFTEPAENLLGYKTWYLCQGERRQSAQVLAVRRQGRGFVASIAGCNTRETAAELNHAEIAVTREELPPLDEGEYYWVDLIGMKVETRSGELLGEVQDLLETGSNDVLIVKGEKGEHLIPYVTQEYILGVNLKSRIIRVEWDLDF